MYVKVCGITRVEDAGVAWEAGASAIGVNLVAGSPREVDRRAARAIVAAAAGRLETVAVVRGAPPAALRSLREELGVDWLQIHDDERGEALVAELPGSFLAVRIGDQADVERARAVPGARLLVDAKVGGVLGGSGQSFDWSLVLELAQARPLVLAGGLTPENVARAVAMVGPWGVDVASGVEQPGEPRRKDPARTAAFVAAARARAPQSGGRSP